MEGESDTPIYRTQRARKRNYSLSENAHRGNLNPGGCGSPSQQLAALQPVPYTPPRPPIREHTCPSRPCRAHPVPGRYSSPRPSRITPDPRARSLASHPTFRRKQPERVTFGCSHPSTSDTDRDSDVDSDLPQTVPSNQSRFASLSQGARSCIPLQPRSLPT